MKSNMGKLDRIARVIVAIVFSILFFTGTITGPFAYILLALGGVFMVTAFVRFCPLYLPFKISTCKNKQA